MAARGRAYAQYQHTLVRNYISVPNCEGQEDNVSASLCDAQANYVW
jgi:hypothetical protein